MHQPIKNLLVVNTQSFGDIMLSTHIATLAKRYLPDVKVHFFIRPDLTLTTAESNKDASMDMLKIIAMQDNIASVGYIHNEQLFPMLGKDMPKALLDFKVIIIQGWSSELGIVGSQIKPFYDMFNITDKLDTETKFNIEGSIKPKEKRTIGMAGDLDFLRKWDNPKEYEKFLAMISANRYNINIEKFGVDVENIPYSEQLAKLLNCDLVIAPMGSLIHIAAGLGIDTISLTSVFPAEYDCPEFYHSGWHRHIKAEDHCGTFRCVTWKPEDNQSSWGNPKTEWGFWPRNCPFTKSGKSCNDNSQAQQLINHFNEWYND